MAPFVRRAYDGRVSGGGDNANDGRVLFVRRTFVAVDSCDGEVEYVPDAVALVEGWVVGRVVDDGGGRSFWPVRWLDPVAGYRDEMVPTGDVLAVNFHPTFP